MSIVSFFDKIESPVSVFCAIAGLIVTIIIAVVQYKQGKKMEKLEIKQNETEKKHREQRIKAERDAFIMKYHNENGEIYLLPLCWISSVYNSSLNYSRKMYMEYNMLEEDVQLAVCERMNFRIDKPKITENKFYDECVKAISEKEKEYYDSETVQYHTSLFYDHAKYLLRCIEYHKSKPLPIYLYKLDNKLTDCLRDYKENKSSCPDPLDKYAKEFGFTGATEDAASEICAVAAKWVAEWNQDDTSEDYWFPEYYYDDQVIETLEDLFLSTLLRIYIYLIMPKETE